MYRSPVLGMMVTMVLPADSGRLPTSNAAQMAAPDEMPHSIPSSLAAFQAN